MEESNSTVLFLRKRKDRVLASILSFKDRECNQYLPEDLSSNLRKLILDEVNSFFDTVSSVIEEDSGINSLYLQKLQDLSTVMDDILEKTASE